ncbi:MoaD/ThiS family protein [Olivibacter sitiensis]|uniref:MoaD/ThiS family protein n=1 Tax=Olivibacter sitiensis TaxID=376470 RepID=UPI0004153E6D|nr:MoaD/ThiS family protein [Olivibacter sitiensis]
MKIKLFGRLVEITGQREIEIDQVYDRAQLILVLQENYPALVGISYAVAIDRQIVSENVALDQDMEIALLPPFSGG